MNPRVIVVGDLVTDVLATLAEPLVPGSDAAARVQLTGGGQAANTAAWLARCQVPATLVAAVGDDQAGRDRVAELAAAGVDCAVRAVPDLRTGTLVVLASGDDRTMLADRGAADALAPADVDLALDRWPDAGHLHLSGYTLLGNGSRPAGWRALAAARARHLTTSVDAASAGPLRQVGPAAFLEWIDGVDLLLANVDEAVVLGAAAGDAARAVVVKRGPAGAVWAAGGTVVEVPAPAVDAVDPTGAGDAFAAGLLCAWLAGAGPAAALYAGSRLGAEAVTNPGARPA